VARCERCGVLRTVSTRQTRRIEAGHSGSLCNVCRGGEIVARDQDYRFWLNLYGVPVPDPPASAFEAVVASGLPPDLADLATEFVLDSTG
jgi:hypothetical protein